MKAIPISAMTALALLCACSPAPPATTSSTQVAITPGPEQDALIAALTPVITSDLGQPVVFTVDTARAEGDWGWLVVTPKTPAGTAIDFSTTKYASQAEAGVLDGGGTTYALLQRQNGAWTVRDFVVGPSDVAYMDWPQRYGAPAALMGLAQEPK